MRGYRMSKPLPPSRGPDVLDTRHTLTYAPRPDGRPLWEPPILDYSALINQDDYHKKREVLIKFYNGNLAHVTRWFDLETHHDLSAIYEEWLSETEQDANEEQFDFLRDLRRNLIIDSHEDDLNFRRLGLQVTKQEDGEYTAISLRDFYAKHREEMKEKKEKAIQAAAAQAAKDGQCGPPEQLESGQTRREGEEATHLSIDTESDPSTTQSSLFEATSEAPSEPNEMTALLPRNADTQEQTTNVDEVDTEASVLRALCSCACI